MDLSSYDSDVLINGENAKEHVNTQDFNLVKMEFFSLNPLDLSRESAKIMYKSSANQ
jgi:hypothetical protein